MRKLKASELPELRRQAVGKRCALCTEPMVDIKKMVVDHDHHTGEVRGVICSWCNGRLGKVENAANTAKRSLTLEQWLLNALAYRKNTTGLMYPTHKTEAEKKAATAAKRKAAAVKKAAAIMKAKQ